MTLSPPLATISRDDAKYPAILVDRLGNDAPAALYCRGASGLLHQPMRAVFCSLHPPADLVMPGAALGRQLCEPGDALIGGFQSPMERLILNAALRASVPVAISPARRIDTMRLEPDWRLPARDGRLLITSRIATRRRSDGGLALLRNRLVAALAAEVVIVHASQGGRVYTIVEEAISWGVPVTCLDHPANEALFLLGARPWREGSPFSELAPLMGVMERRSPT